MRYARVIDSTAVEVFENGGLTPAECFMEPVAEQFEPVPAEVLPGWIRDKKGKWSGPAAPEEVLPARAPHVTVLAFRQRFSAAEKTAIELAALDDPSAAPEQRARAAALRVYQSDVQVATFIDLDNPEIRTAVAMMETLGLLDAGRAQAITDTPPTDAERP